MAYSEAKQKYAQLGVDTDKAIENCRAVPLSIHCWQLDDCGGFENSGQTLSGGIQSTGNCPGKARDFKEMAADVNKAFALIPGEKKLNIHAMYLENHGRAVDRDEIEPSHFDGWIALAEKLGVGLDFNGTFFSHPLSADGYTLSHSDPKIRRFWVNHALRCRQISAYMAQKTGKTVVDNLWIPDGEKEVPADTLSPRQRLRESLDEIYQTPLPGVVDSVESKLFGIGSEAYVVGSHEFYLAYALKRDDLCVTLDTGHFHPTETVSSKLSALLPFLPGLLLHISRPVRWDSDHIVLLDDETRAIMRELKRLSAYKKTYLGLDYFDGSVSRVLALAVGARNARKAMLEAFLEPTELIRKAEISGDKGLRLALQEEVKSLPASDVWEELCRTSGTPASWLADACEYGRVVAEERG